MSALLQILPGTGRGTMRSMVEGAHIGIVANPFEANCSIQRWAPSTAFGGPPPRAGEDL
jgi:hypothetical protein